MLKKPAPEQTALEIVTLDSLVPKDHLLRKIDAVIDFSFIHDRVAGLYCADNGRPPLDPTCMFKALFIGYLFGIRSERRLCEEVHLNLAYRWFCRLGLEDRVPDHSTFSKNRHGRFRQSDALRFVFESVLKRCMGEGLVQGEGFAIDASVIKADANGARGVPGVEVVDWRKEEASSRAVREYLEALEAQNASHEAASDDQQPSTPPAHCALAMAIYM